MRCTTLALWKVPKNLSVAPRYDVWNEKYEPWAHMKRMGKIVGTGFYIPPEWYNHFRMFPPIHHNYQQEQTLNPRNASEPTQDDQTTVSAERQRVRDELSRRSRALASEGMRYYNLFWVQKPLDAMERQYYRLKKEGIVHDIAIKSVLQQFYDSLAVKQRVSHIQAEEAKLSGGFITMREATAVLGVLSQLQREQLTPHQVTNMAQEKLKEVTQGALLRAKVSEMKGPSSPATTATSTAAQSSSALDAAIKAVRNNPRDAAAPADGAPATEEAAPPTAGSSTTSADVLDSVLQEDSTGSASAIAASSSSGVSVDISTSPNDHLPKLQEVATDGTGDVNWYDYGILYDVDDGKPAPAGS